MNGLKTLAAKKRKSTGSDSPSLTPKRKLFQIKPTQKGLDMRVDKFIFCNRLPHNTVDKKDFRDLALYGIDEDLKLECRQSLRKRMDERFKLMNENLKKELDRVKYVAGFADGWSKYRRGFLGMTCTWIEPKTLERFFAGLSLRRIKGSHTHRRLAEEMSNILQEYGLKNGKMTKITTDSGSNFLKSFKVFGAVDLMPLPAGKLPFC